jgi:hypothetical protein
MRGERNQAMQVKRNRRVRSTDLRTARALRDSQWKYDSIPSENPVWAGMLRRVQIWSICSNLLSTDQRCQIFRAWIRELGISLGKDTSVAFEVCCGRG